jgi:hypothetical protein
VVVSVTVANSDGMRPVTVMGSVEPAAVPTVTDPADVLGVHPQAAS